MPKLPGAQTYHPIPNDYETFEKLLSQKDKDSVIYFLFRIIPIFRKIRGLVLKNRKALARNTVWLQNGLLKIILYRRKKESTFSKAWVTYVVQASIIDFIECFCQKNHFYYFKVIQAIKETNIFRSVVKKVLLITGKYSSIYILML